MIDALLAFTFFIECTRCKQMFVEIRNAKKDDLDSYSQRKPLVRKLYLQRQDRWD